MLGSWSSGFLDFSWIAVQQSVRQISSSNALDYPKFLFNLIHMKCIYTMTLATVYHGWPCQCSFSLPFQHACHTTFCFSHSIPWIHATSLVPKRFFHCNPPCSSFSIPQLLASSDKWDCQCYKPWCALHNDFWCDQGASFSLVQWDQTSNHLIGSRYKICVSLPVSTTPPTASLD